MQPAYLKRKTPQEMIESAATFERAHGPATPVPNTGGRGGASFFVVPRFHACIRTSPSAVDFYFDVLHPRRSWRTLGVRTAFKAAVFSRAARTALTRSGLLHSVHPAPHVPGVQWEDFDVLLGEWQFTGAFSGRRGTVSHILTQDQYADSLQNEVGARRALEGVVRTPRIHGAWTEGEARGWTEDIVFQSPPADDRPVDQAQAMMLQAYRATRSTVSMGLYIDGLQEKADERYAGGPAEAKGRVDALLDLARRTSDEAGLHSLTLARCHGDLNWAQMVGPPEAPFLIDWSESEVCAVFHDLVFSSIRYGRWRNYADKDYPDMFGILRDELRDEMDGVPGAFASALVLAEVGVKQYVDHTQGRGTWRDWRNHVDELFEAVSRRATESKSPAIAA